MDKTTANFETIQAAPPKLIGSLRAGFDIVASHIGLILFPVILDLLLWFGPHFSLKTLLMPLIDSMSKVPGMDAPELSDLVSAARETWQAIAQQFNLASALRTYPVGIPSLEAGQLPLHTPFGSPVLFSLPSFSGVFGVWLIFFFIGLVGGSLYFDAIAHSLTTHPETYTLKASTWAAGQTILLTLGWIVLILAITIPGMIMISILALISPVVAQIGTLIFSVLAVWLIVPLLFSPHGIFLFHQNAFTSMLTSVRLVRFLLPGTGMFFLVVVVLSQGLNLLWQVPPDNSWMSLIGIAGHGFVSTALIAASFVYYRDAAAFVHDLVTQAAASRQNQLKL